MRFGQTIEGYYTNLNFVLSELVVSGVCLCTNIVKHPLSKNLTTKIQKNLTACMICKIFSVSNGKTIWKLKPWGVLMLSNWRCLFSYIIVNKVCIIFIIKSFKLQFYFFSYCPSIHLKSHHPSYATPIKKHALFVMFVVQKI